MASNQTTTDLHMQLTEKENAIAEQLKRKGIEGTFSRHFIMLRTRPQHLESFIHHQDFKQILELGDLGGIDAVKDADNKVCLRITVKRRV